eukprot:TRINITY_DN20972_c0_g1_i1.p1 TRINITY_DN20972_c0_g1~~TRINITY_DN20972_c0_g1_i1.p1  ORF type:complete len:294 (+),score=23.53 TRINITY_DN20972_c0_g1_i1:27-908(+)
MYFEAMFSRPRWFGFRVLGSFVRGTQPTSHLTQIRKDRLCGEKRVTLTFGLIGTVGLSGLGSSYHAQCQEPNETKNQARKLSIDGTKYLPFPGVTMVCDMPRSDTGLLAKLPDVLRSLPTVGPLFTPLPSASYHVTTLDVCTKSETGLDDQAWEAVLRKPCWAVAAAELDMAALRPRLRVKKVVLSPSSLLVELEAADMDTCSHPKDLAINAKIVEVLGLTKNQCWCWHFTLGYWINPDKLRAADAIAVEVDRLAIEEAVRLALPGNVPLEAARLCRFEDMTSFVPWDGMSFK